MKWLAILYQLAARHKINRVLGILNEPASLDEIAWVQPQPRGTALQGVSETAAIQAPATAGFRGGLCATSVIPIQDKRNTQRRKASSLKCHFNPVLKPLHALVPHPTPHHF